MATNAQPLAVIARLLDLSERRVQQLSREGVIPKAERGRYDLVGAVRGYVAYLRDLAVKAQSGAPDFGVERARLIKAKADLAEMEADGRRGELLPADAVEAAWTAVLARLRAVRWTRPTCSSRRSPAASSSASAQPLLPNTAASLKRTRR